MKARKYLRTILFLLSSVLFGFLCFSILNNSGIILTPKEIRLEYENENYKQDYDSLKERSIQIEKALENLSKQDAETYRRIFEMNRIPEENYLSGYGGVNRYEKYIEKK